MEARGKNVSINQENGIVSARLDAERELRLPDRLTIELVIFLLKPRGHKTI
jgi:hypothetical protein